MARSRADQLDAWLSEWREGASATGTDAAIERRASPDERGHEHWIVRMRGEEKESIAVWLRLGPRRLHLECELVPAPEENAEALFQYVLRRNEASGPVHVALGAHDALYLVASVDVTDLSVERLDELLAACVVQVDEMYPTAMSLAHPRWFRRRPRRG